jgi:hypothetical protein
MKPQCIEMHVARVPATPYETRHDRREIGPSLDRQRPPMSWLAAMPINEEPRPWPA